MENIYEELSIANISSFIILSFGDILEKETFVWTAAAMTVLPLDLTSTPSAKHTAEVSSRQR